MPGLTELAGAGRAAMKTARINGIEANGRRLAPFKVTRINGNAINGGRVEKPPSFSGLRYRTARINGMPVGKAHEVSKGAGKGFWGAFKEGAKTNGPKRLRRANREMKAMGATRAQRAGVWTGHYAPPIAAGAAGSAGGMALWNRKGVDSGKTKFGKAGFATRDEHSSIGATVTRRHPEGPGQRGSLHARSGYAAGRTRGVGRKESRDENSTPHVTRMVRRTPGGQYASHENRLTVVRPERRYSTQPKDSQLGIHHKGRGSETRGYVEKAADPLVRASMQNVMRMAKPKKVPSQATVSRGAMARLRGNTKFGGAGTRGRKLVD